MEYLSNQYDIEQFPMDDLGNRVGSVTQRGGTAVYSSASPNLTNRYTIAGGTGRWDEELLRRGMVLQKGLILIE